MTAMTDSRAVEVLRWLDAQACDPDANERFRELRDYIARLREPAEAQAQGGGEVVAHGFYDPATGAYSETQRTPRWLPAVVCTAPPSAPVGVEAQEHAETLARQLRWSTTSKRMRAALEAGIASLRALAQQPAAVDRARFRKAPCYLCGYNGAGYFQPETHPCAALYHATQPGGSDNDR